MGISKVPYSEPAHLQGLSSPYFKESHIKLRHALREYMSDPDIAEDALECEATSRAPNPELRKRFGECGLTAMAQGPGEHLKLAPNGLPGGVTAEEFDYFHELVVHEERSRHFAP